MSDAMVLLSKHVTKHNKLDDHSTVLNQHSSEYECMSKDNNNNVDIITCELLDTTVVCDKSILSYKNNMFGNTQHVICIAPTFHQLKYTINAIVCQKFIEMKPLVNLMGNIAISSHALYYSTNDDQSISFNSKTEVIIGYPTIISTIISKAIELMLRSILMKIIIIIMTLICMNVISQHASSTLLSPPSPPSTLLHKSHNNFELSYALLPTCYEGNTTLLSNHNNDCLSPHQNQQQQKSYHPLSPQVV